MLKNKKLKEKLTIPLIEGKIGIISKEWIGNCYGIASKILKSGIVKGKLRYGHFLGEVKKDTLFDDGVHFSRHGWIEMKNGTIIDATRWVFEGKKPYIFIGKDLNKEYDIGGQEWRKTVLNPPPEFDNTKEINFPVSINTKEFILNELDYPYITFAGLFWIANLPVDMLGNFAQEIYVALEEIGKKVLIPIDNYNFVIN